MAMLNKQRVILQLKSCLGNVFTNSCKIGKLVNVIKICPKKSSQVSRPWVARVWLQSLIEMLYGLPFGTPMFTIFTIFTSMDVTIF
jgi:hypothetical protein